MPIFSIVTVCRNNLSGLKRTHASVVQQTGQDYEWIVVDGASTDGTVEWLDSAVSLPEFAYISETDEGLYDAMNKGSEMAQGDYIIYMNSGDEFASDSILADTTWHLDNWAGSSSDVVYGDSIEEDALHQKLSKRSLSHKRVWYSMFAHHQAIFYRRDKLPAPAYNTEFSVAADWALTAKLYVEGANFRRLPFAVCVFERGGLSQSYDKGIVARIRRERLQVYDQVFQYSRLRTGLILLIKEAAEQLRERLPGLYDRLRFRRSKGARPI
ncbi:glycosyltransferase family 2 protein [Parvibaculaceae bacterium PLY_AMNH_Bact1]|nr:glycosyltransferase family 2 protein [Parvibaculaceae bacterium PLY_AMNH_Bact1]